MLNIAHRGARNAAPENTIEAIEKAAELCADAVEIDVQMTADGSVIAIHDDDLVRCTDVTRRYPERRPWRVSEFGLAEIRSLDAGGWFAAQLRAPVREREAWLQTLTDDEREAYVRPADMRHYASGAVKVPLLTECVDACKRLGLALHIELKLVPRFYPQLAEKVIASVRRLRMEDEIVLSSFDHAALAGIRMAAPEIRTAVLSSDRLWRPAHYLASVGASAYNPGCAGENDTIGLNSVTGRLDREMIAEVRAAGCDVYVWTENDPERMARLIDAGVSGIYTDYPNRLRALLDQRGVTPRVAGTPEPG